MRIMHVVDSLALGGAERMLVEIANRSAVDGHLVSVCVTRQGCALTGSLRPEVSVFVLDRRRRFDWAAMRRFATLAKGHQVDVFHSHGRSTFSFLALAKAIRLIQQPIVFHDHYGSMELDSSIPRWFRLWARHYVARYVGVSPKLATWAQDGGISPDQISVIQNALDLSRFREAPPIDLRAEFGVPTDALVGILVGNIRREKGIDILLAALARSTHYRSFTILVVGGDADQEYAAACHAQSDAQGLSDCVLFVGQRPDVPNILRSADFALLPSRSESGPLVLIEYMASGLPFVAARVGGIAERVAELKIPEFVPAGDVNAFAGALDRLLRLTSDERRIRGAAGQEIALRQFDIRAMMAEWYKVYASTIGSAYSTDRRLGSKSHGEGEVLH
jgi:glycosyltransferase involved in cell wall biosynthesis